DQKVDVETLVAAILHDTIEDTPLTREQLAAEFGETVAELVDGVTKLDKLHFSSRQEAAAESFRKMMLAMARDLRVILIKLSDRLHNMRTLGAQPAPARQRIARETLEIYAPIAQRLGMNLIKAELQDRGFHALHPLRHLILEKHIRSQPMVRREAMSKIEAQLAQRLTAEGLEYRLVSRVKSPWSIYSKMRSEGKTFAQVMDVFGFRIVLQSVGDCYRALGVAHSVYKPLDGRFRDFIAIPKANGYQSLHTVLFGPYGSPIEVQIRTEEMDLIAERGIAAHWAYKHGTAASGAPARAGVVAGVPGERQGRPVPRRGLPVHAQGRHPRPAAQLHRARLRLRGAYRRRQHRGGGARGQEACAAAYQAGERPVGRGGHREVGVPQAAVAGSGGHRQGAHRDPRPAQAARARGRGDPRPPHDRPRAGGRGH